MRQLTYILIFIVLTTISSCWQNKTKSNFEKKNINVETVDSIEISNRTGQSDTIENQIKRLTKKQVIQFIEKFNNSKEYGLIKALPLYFVDVYLKDSTIRSFRISGQFIMENNDYSFDLGDRKFIESIWTDLNANNIKSALKSKMTDQEKQIVKKSKRKLRYLYFANGGLRGYFNDGTIAGCPKCDFCRSNILTLFNEKSIGTYQVQADGSLLINTSEIEFPNCQADSGWALIDFQWNVKVPQN